MSNEAPFFYANATNKVALGLSLSTMRARFLLRATDQTDISTCLEARYQQFTQLLRTQLTAILQVLGLSRKHCKLNFRKRQ